MKFKVGDVVVRFQKTVLNYNDETYPVKFEVDRIISSSSGNCLFGKVGNGTYEVDLRLATKLEKVLK